MPDERERDFEQRGNIGKRFDHDGVDVWSLRHALGATPAMPGLATEP
jgi:hypothetical protein